MMCGKGSDFKISFYFASFYSKVMFLTLRYENGGPFYEITARGSRIELLEFQ